MRTTISLDEDVLLAARAIATQQQRTLGEVISDLARRSLAHPPSGAERNGIPLLARRPDSPPVTLDLVNSLRDEAP